MDFPFAGEFFRAKDRRHEPVVFFVHFYLGKKEQLLRHIRLVNQFGYDAFAFNLDEGRSKLRLPITKDGRFGLKHFYADRIEQLLDVIQGPKIVFAFSKAW